jgi:hypothetical protein
MRPATPDDRLGSRLGRSWPWAALTAAMALAVYAPTVARDLSWAGAATDGGELITASFTLGVPHPPGYPTYVVLGKLVSLLPLGTVAFRYNLFSAVCAALAAGLLFAAIRAHWDGRVRPVTAIAAALAFAWLPLVWSQAVVAEVYALNLLFVAAFLLTGVAAGLLPLLLLPWLARGDSPVVWGRPDTPGGWWWLVSGRLYAANLLFSPDFASPRLATLLRALALGPAALIIGRRPRRGQASGAPSVTRRARRTRLMGATAALYALFALAYATPDAAVLLLPALLLLALLLAPGLERAGRLSLALPLVLAVVGLAGHTGAAGPSPRALALAALGAAPSRAVLLTPGDRGLFTLWYFHHVEGLRPDVVIVDANLFAFDWYRQRLAVQQPDLFVPAADDLPAFEETNARTRPFCAISLAAPPTVLCIEE